MKIMRMFPSVEEPLKIELTPEELEEAYRIVQKQYELEDIKGEIEDMDEDDLSGFKCDEIVNDDALMEEIHARFTKSKDCTLPYWDVMDESIRCALEEKQKGEC